MKHSASSRSSASAAAAQPADASLRALSEVGLRLRELTTRRPGDAAPPTRTEVEAVLGDAAAVSLDLQRILLRAKQARRDALLAGGTDPAALSLAVDLSAQIEETSDGIAVLDGLVAAVRRSFTSRD